MSTHETWMDLAISLAKAAEPSGNTPVAAVIVRDGVELGRGTNLVTPPQDPLLHAETTAIQDACRRAGTASLAGAVLYSTMEPCPMCAWAIRCAGITEVVLGARFPDLDRRDMGGYAIEKLMAMAENPMTITPGVRRLECIALRKDWMVKTGRVI
jgi:tRNA(adenine34) deaminase